MPVCWIVEALNTIATPAFIPRSLNFTRRFRPQGEKKLNCRVIQEAQQLFELRRWLPISCLGALLRRSFSKTGAQTTGRQLAYLAADELVWRGTVNGDRYL